MKRYFLCLYLENHPYFIKNYWLFIFKAILFYIPIPVEESTKTVSSFEAGPIPAPPHTRI